MRIKRTVSEAEFQELIRPKLKLFLSVDVVGSTRFKQADAALSTGDWLGKFVDFYRDFPDRLGQCLLSQNHGRRLAEPLLWKSLGDELIFTVQLEARRDAALYLKAFMEALQGTLENWQRSADLGGLSVKGAAWLAGFPVGNAEIPLEGVGTASGGDHRDYIGPLIDTGFRIKEHASPRRLVLSADLCYLLVSCSLRGLGPGLFYEGEHPLKGVLGGRPYPLFWLDCGGRPPAAARMNRCRDRLAGRKPAPADDVRKFLRLWFGEHCGHIPKPFILADAAGDLEPPADYESRRQATEENLRRILLLKQEPDVENAGEERLPASLAEFVGEG